ncbi:unnamed protein product [Polarella glacialis]|uniref:Uncharacterized protein n=1 Tax=Polarella glacialis TaxID=89957 RepID=A0A813KRK2_POLGL|nr:unnamed protein product [Polarella glacialis]CAE8710070.1 unnamed protein product [Polarella glacialis]
MELLRQKGDAALSEKRWVDAMRLYTEALALPPLDGGRGSTDGGSTDSTTERRTQQGEDPALLTSLSLACLKSKDFSAANVWASKAIKFGGRKAWCIRGMAVLDIALRRPNIRMAELRCAQRDLRRAVELFPEDLLAQRKLYECNGFLTDLEQNPPDLFPSELRTEATCLEVLRARQHAAFVTGDFEILELESRKSKSEEWADYGKVCGRNSTSADLEYGHPGGDWEEDPNFPVGSIYTINCADALPGREQRLFLAVWKDAASGRLHEESFELKGLREIMAAHLAAGAGLCRGPATDEFCLLEPDDYASRESRVGFDAHTYWSAAALWSALGTTGVKYWDDELLIIKANGLRHPDIVSTSATVPSPPTKIPAAFQGGAADLKTTGNSFFKNGRWQEAVQSYKAALACCQGGDDGMRAALHANLAQCFLRLELFRRAGDSATSCLALEPGHIKALFRRATAYEWLRKFENALADLDEILTFDAENLEATVAHSRVKRRADVLAGQGDVAGDWGQAPLASLPNEEWGQTSEGCQESARVPQQTKVLNLPACVEVLPLREQYEWLVDCYRLRLDDDHAAGASRGLYAPEARKGTILEDWLVFCKLLAARGLAVQVDWCALLQVAGERLSASPRSGDEAFAHSGGEMKSPTEDTQHSMAQEIYGTHGGLVEIVREEVKRGLRNVDPNLFDDFGGVSVWQNLLFSLCDPVCKEA